MNSPVNFSSTVIFRALIPEKQGYEIQLNISFVTLKVCLSHFI